MARPAWRKAGLPGAGAESLSTMKSGFSLGRLVRTILFGILLIPLCCFWAQSQSNDRIFSLMIPPLAITMMVAGLNVGVRRWLPRLALSGGEIVVLYSMLAASCAMSAEWMDMIAPQVYGYAIYKENNSRYEEKILPFISDWFFFKDPEPLKDFRYGGKPFALTMPIFLAALPLWMPKILAWTLLLTLLVTTMLCINALIKDQWIQQEKLAFPVVQIPLALAQEGESGSFWRSKLLWGAFAVVFAIDMWNGFSFLYPALPPITIRFLGRLDEYLKVPPWNSTGWIPLGIFPFMSAIGFFMPTDLLFSLLFFYFVRKAQQIIAYILGNEQGVFGGGGLVPSPPYFSEQSWGAFFAMFVSAMWLARPHWQKVWEDIKTGRSNGDDVPHRFTFILLVLCLLGLGLIGMGMGMALPFVLFYITLYLIFSVAVTRLRAQLGAPTHEMAFMGPHQLIIDFRGTAGWSVDDVSRTMTAFHMMNRLHRTHPMPFLLEGQYLADRVGFPGRVMFVSLIVAIVLGTIVGFLTHIYIGYRYTPTSWISSEVAGVVSTIVDTPRPPSIAAMFAVVAGAGVVFILDAIRFRFPGFLLHPAGYALAMNFGVDYYWFGLLIVLIVKVFVERYQGLKGSQKLRLVAIGLILGEVAAELIWATFSMLNDRQLTYTISINGKMGWDQ
ncbi:MAG: hypothetical protein OHK0029_17790 [Armatimonadaceae bacterium]